LKKRGKLQGKANLRNQGDKPDVSEQEDGGGENYTEGESGLVVPFEHAKNFKAGGGERKESWQRKRLYLLRLECANEAIMNDGSARDRRRIKTKKGHHHEDEGITLELKTSAGINKT